MNRRTRIIATILAFLGLGAGVALAGHGWRHRDRDPAAVSKFVEARIDKGLSWLDATDAQRDAVIKVKDRLLPQFLALKGQRAELRTFALANWNAEKPDAQAIHAEIDARIDAIRALAHEAADGVIEVHGVLTPEQRAQIAEKVGKHHRDR